MKHRYCPRDSNLWLCRMVGADGSTELWRPPQRMENWTNKCKVRWNRLKRALKRGVIELFYNIVSRLYLQNAIFFEAIFGCFELSKDFRVEHFTYLYSGKTMRLTFAFRRKKTSNDNSRNDFDHSFKRWFNDLNCLPTQIQRIKFVFVRSFLFLKISLIWRAVDDSLMLLYKPHYHTNGFNEVTKAHGPSLLQPTAYRSPKSSIRFHCKRN